MNRSTRRTTRLLSVANECIILFNKHNLYLESDIQNYSFAILFFTYYVVGKYLI